MKNSLLPLLSILCLAANLQAQIQLENWKFKTGDDRAWASPTFDDSGWTTIKGTTAYENQGYDYNGYSWYRVHFRLPSSLRAESFLKDSLRIIVGRVDDIDATYLNGRRIGGIGKFPEEPGGPAGLYDALRRYALPWNHPDILWDAENVVAVRVFDGGGGGGLWRMMPSVGIVDLIDFVALNVDAGAFDFSKKGEIQKLVKVENRYFGPVEGTLTLRVQPRKGGSAVEQSVAVRMAAHGSFSHTFSFPRLENARVTYVFSEKNTRKTLTTKQITPYILTPPERPEPKITNAAVFGTRPVKQFQWSVTGTGERPMTFGATGLPEALSIDPATGLITGMATQRGEFEVELTAQNALGKAAKKVKIIIGKRMSLTPPMGWNSWNCWGLAVSDERVRQSADAMLTSGLANHGWSYINIDDGWQGERDAAGDLQPNEKFSDMKGLGDWLHGRGLKFGLYSSPGDKTCGGFAGSLGHEQQDARQWSAWGLDYIKYDWCSYTQHLEKQDKDMKAWSVEDQILPFRKLADALGYARRDITFSVCNWGMGEVWKWGDRTGGQLWRTTGDIEDSWASVSSIGFSQAEPAKFTRPGGWGDPDMLIVGWVGWGDKLHQTRLTPAEQYTHISQWAMLSAPLMIGCDLSRLDAFTYNLLANDEVLAIDQDPLGKAAQPVLQTADTQVWVKELADGSRAVAIYNLSENDRKVSVLWKDLKLEGFKTLRDVWRQQDLGALKKKFSAEVDGHGVVLLVLGK